MPKKVLLKNSTVIETRLNFPIDPKVRDRLALFCRERGINMKFVAAKAIREFLERNEKIGKAAGR